MRYFQKAMRRAEIPIAYSDGFSPHQVMSFAAPLGVGLYSNGEYMDIELTKEVSTDWLKDTLNEAMVEGIHIVSARALPEKAGNAMASVAAAGYTVTVRAGHEPSFPFGDRFEEFMSQEQICFTKQTKKNVIEMNLKDGIYDFQRKASQIYLLVDASSSGNIKPTMIMQSYYEFMGSSIGEFDFVVTREETYTRDENNKLIPLEEAGYDIA